ncbi:DUF4164 family protein [Bartonella sp. DGB1]|uniref:DUF4164 family protein n=1 Tax=Bartonella sp. DGB1 TaxID=3239807 RepID=UPI0035252D38
MESLNIDKAVEELDISIKHLEHKLQISLDKIELSADISEQLQRLNIDRNNLANELDESADKIERLLTANNEISVKLTKIIDSLKMILQDKP